MKAMLLLMACVTGASLTFAQSSYSTTSQSSNNPTLNNPSNPNVPNTPSRSYSPGYNQGSSSGYNQGSTSGYNQGSTYNQGTTTIQQPQTMSEMQFNPQAMQTVMGTVSNVERVVPGQGRPGETLGQLTIQTSSGPMTVILGPTWYMDQQSNMIETGDHVTVTGSRITMNGRTVLMASQINKDGEVIMLRDSTGMPLWSRGAQSSQNGSQSSQGNQSYQGSQSSQSMQNYQNP